MKLHKISFEIHDITTDELLVDNLAFEDIPELLQAYTMLYPMHRIEPCYRTITITQELRLMPQEEFTHDWYELLDDIIDNLYRG